MGNEMIFSGHWAAYNHYADLYEDLDHEEIVFLQDRMGYTHIDNAAECVVCGLYLLELSEGGFCPGCLREAEEERRAEEHQRSWYRSQAL